MFEKRGWRRCRTRGQIIVLGQATKKAGSFCLSLTLVFANVNTVYHSFGLLSNYIYRLSTVQLCLAAP